jgi:DNA-binding MarR family transcriptional regulator
VGRTTTGAQQASQNGDHVDHLVEQWRTARPDLDVSPMGVIARISRLSRILERQIEEVYGAYGLNQAQFGVLAALRRAGPPFCLSPTALYNSLLISSGAMTNRLDRLTAAGLVRRVPDPSDGRSMLVALTPRGRRLIDRVVTIHYENEHRLLASLAPRERQQLSTILRKLLLEFEDHAPPVPARRGAVATGRSSPRPPARSARSRTRPPATPGT